MTPSPASFALKDVVDGFRRLDVVWYLAYDDLRGRFRRTVLGPLWVALANLVFILGVGFVFSQVFQADLAGFLIYLAAGMAPWALFSSIVAEAPQLFVRSKTLFETYPLPWSVTVLRSLIGHSLVFTIHLTVFFLLALGFGASFSLSALLAIPGVLALIASGYGLGLGLGVLGARFRDLGPAIGAVLPFLFILTPIFWRVSDLGGSRPAVTHFNPIFHYIDAIRSPLIGETVDPMTWQFVGVGAVLCLAFGLGLYARWRRHLYYWL